MSYAIDIILSKAALVATREHLKQMNEVIKAKNPNHEWIEKNQGYIDDLGLAYQFMMAMDLDMVDLRGVNFNQYKLIMEHEREIEKLKKQNQELKEML
jgi:hypothetical protein